jgi:hypothetical protein
MRLPIALPIHISILLLPPQQKALLFVVVAVVVQNTTRLFVRGLFEALFARAKGLSRWFDGL